MKVIFAFCMFFFATTVLAQELAPDAQLKKIADEVIAIAKQDTNVGAGNQNRTIELVDAKVLPYFNFNRMTALAVGRNWTKASAEQQVVLTKEFHALLVRTYSSALSTYKNRVIEFKPLRAAAGDSDVTVRTQIKQPGTQPIDIDYSMEKTAGGWKVYDVVVGGVSLVTSYRETFNAEIRDHGVDGLIKTLASKNHSAEGQAGAKRG